MEIVHQISQTKLDSLIPPTDPSDKEGSEAANEARYAMAEEVRSQHDEFPVYVKHGRNYVMRVEARGWSMHHGWLPGNKKDKTEKHFTDIDVSAETKDPADWWKE